MASGPLLQRRSPSPASICPKYGFGSSGKLCLFLTLCLDHAPDGVVRGEMRVTHRCVNVGVSQVLFYGSEVDAAHDPLGSPVVPEIVLKPTVVTKANYQSYETPIESRACPTWDDATKLGAK